jgi:hypothetical protein
MALMPTARASALADATDEPIRVGTSSGSGLGTSTGTAVDGVPASPSDPTPVQPVRIARAAKTVLLTQATMTDPHPLQLGRRCHDLALSGNSRMGDFLGKLRRLAVVPNDVVYTTDICAQSCGAHHR